MPGKYSELHQPSLEEMLADPIVWMVMKSDQVEEHELRSLLQRVAVDFAGGDAEASGVETTPETGGAYRRGVGIMLLNDRKEVFVGQRVDAEGEAWQMPQGGIDEDEEPRDAAFRELKEEIGTDKGDIIAESKAWLRYDLPPELRKRWHDRWQGQQQKWFVMGFQGVDSGINIEYCIRTPRVFCQGNGSRPNNCRTSSSRSSASSTSICCRNCENPEQSLPVRTPLSNRSAKPSDAYGLTIFLGPLYEGPGMESP